MALIVIVYHTLSLIPNLITSHQISPSYTVPSHLPRIPSPLIHFPSLPFTVPLPKSPALCSRSSCSVLLFSLQKIASLTRHSHPHSHLLYSPSLAFPSLLTFLHLSLSLSHPSLSQHFHMVTPFILSITALIPLSFLNHLPTSPFYISSSLTLLIFPPFLPFLLPFLLFASPSSHFTRCCPK